MSERQERGERGERGDADATQGRRPSDTEQLIGDTAASDPLTDAHHVVQPAEAASRERGASSRSGQPADASDDDAEAELGHS